jgi:LPS sulfotransferase NodH
VRSTRAFRLRRLAWRIRRSGPRIARPISRVLRDPGPPEKPVLIIGCPRSGTTLLLRALLQSGELRSVQSEGHILWDEFHHPRDRDWDSDALAVQDLSRREQEYVYRAIRTSTRGRRFVDKTPESCLRIPYLDALFPDATFVFLRRQAADNVSSLMEAWSARPRFVKYRLPEELTGLGPLSGNRWSFTLVPGWRELHEAPLEEICARQYVASNDAVLEARGSTDGERWVDVFYERLVADPVDEVRRLYAALDLQFSHRVERFAETLAESISPTSVTAPRRDKWRDQYAEEIERILPLVVATERRLGY